MTLTLLWWMEGQRSLLSARSGRVSVNGRSSAVARSRPPGRPSPRPPSATSGHADNGSSLLAGELAAVFFRAS